MLALSEERLKCLGKVVRGFEKIVFLKLCVIKKRERELKNHKKNVSLLFVENINK